MATVSQELLVGRNAKTHHVAIQYDGQDDSPAESLWLATVTAPYTAVMTKSVVSDQLVRDTLEDRIVAAGEAAYGDYNLYTEQGIGYDGLPQPLVVLGDGTEALAAANSATTTLDIGDFVTGGYQPLTWALDPSSVIDLAGASATMIGSVLQYISGAVDGTDVAVVTATDRNGNTATVTVTITVV